MVIGMRILCLGIGLDLGIIGFICMFIVWFVFEVRVLLMSS